MGDMDGQPDEGAACDGMEDDVGAAAEQPGDLTDAMLYSATLKVQLWVSPAGHTHGFSARIIGGRLLSERQFNDREAFVRFIERLTDTQPGLR